MVKAELDELISEFFGAVSFEVGSMPAYAGVPALFIERGLLIKNVGLAPEIASIDEFIERSQSARAVRHADVFRGLRFRNRV